ncbi:MAG TPA: TOBE domain-containing protein [Ideonella sp.]|nr:TOBE domain-containing protein [Ideonella sp.]
MKHETPPLSLSAELWLSVEGKGVAGHKRIALLEQIDRLGSITHAAKAVGLSYKGAWDAVEEMNNLSGAPLLARSAGGKGGGSTRLTERGTQLLKNFRLIQQEHQRFLARLNEQAQGLHHDYLLLESMTMKTSARNQFAGAVTALRAGAVNDEIELEVIGGLKIAATITHESCIDLDLAVGKRATALIKASSVMIVTEPGDAKFSARNQFAGEVSRVIPGAVNTEVVIALPGGGSVAAIVTNESAQSLALAVGKPATAMFKVSSVILAVPA